MSPENVTWPFRVESNYRYETVEPRFYGPSRYIDFPVRLSMPVPPGACPAGTQMVVRDGAGRILSGQVRPLLTWPDGSVRVWDAVFPLSLAVTEEQPFTLGPGTPPPPLSSRAPVQPSSVRVTLALADSTTLSCDVPIASPATDGAPCRRDEFEFELKTPDTRACFRGAVVRTTWRWYPAAEFALRLVNFCRPDTTEVREVRLEFELPGDGPCRYAVWHSTCTASTPRMAEGTLPIIVHADAGGAHVTDVAQLGIRETDFAPYERGAYLGQVDNWVGVADRRGTWVLVVPEAAERWPKGWRADGRHVTIEVHPAWAEPLAWRQGMALFQRFCLSQLPAGATAAEQMDEGRRWIRPPLVTVPDEVYRTAGWRIPFHYRPDRFPRTEFTIRETWNFEWFRGTFDWGDDGFSKGRRNHEYDFIACAAKEFARTGRHELFKKCRSAAEHMMYTDFVACSDDPWKEGGVPAHCVAHTTGSAYPSHMWTEGLLLYHAMSADPYALRVAMRVGDFFLKYIRERFQVVQATAREMGWTLVALAALYDMTREARYLDGIRTVVDFYLARGADRFFTTDATFCIGVAIIGLDRIRPFHRGAEVTRFILDVTDRMMAHRRDGIGIFDYWHDSERKGFAYIQTHLPEALRIAFELGGDLRYLKAAWRLFRIHMGGAPLTVQDKYHPPESGYAGGYHISWTMGCLQAFAEQGWLDTVQYGEP